LCCEHSQLTTSWRGSRQGLLSRHAHPLKQGTALRQAAASHLRRCGARVATPLSLGAATKGYRWRGCPTPAVAVVSCNSCQQWADNIEKKMTRAQLQFCPYNLFPFYNYVLRQIYDYALITYTQLQFGVWGEITILPLHI